MARLLTVLLATALACGSFASAEAQVLPWDIFTPQPHVYRYDDGRAWRRYPPNYGAEQGPQIIGIVVGGFLTDPCFNGGCHFYHGDVAYAASWGSVDPDPGATGRAFRALSRHADKAAVSNVMVEPSPRHRAHKPHHHPAAE